ncbi:LysM peptidoglycan-binding domain-containing protein [Arthrobacter sp. MDT2-16]
MAMAEARVLQGSTALWALTPGRPEVPFRAVPAGRIRPTRLRTSTQRSTERSTERIAGPVAGRLEERNPERPLTLTRRGRLLLVGLPIALGVAALILLGAFLTSQAQAGESLPESSATVEVSVAAGESLWDLALRHAPDRDPRDVVAEMVELNNLRGSVVQAGQSIAVPVGG